MQLLAIGQNKVAKLIKKKRFMQLLFVNVFLKANGKKTFNPPSAVGVCENKRTKTHFII